MPDKAVTLSILGQIEKHFRRCKHTYPDLVFEGYEDAVRDAITLIREQEAVESDGDNCGECGYTVHRINYDGPDKGLRHEWFRFCPSCGKAVKWDE